MKNNNFALLAAVVYADLSNKKLDDNTIIDSLTSKNTSKLSETQARDFVNTYTIIKHQSETSSGYSGTIVQNKQTKEYFVLH
ncbi:hypothetical protein BMT54_08850 [Pasteurellaceae bacterium 15-036681]|nr:hypothetical protein BMT54_08850 [Pasteurellaceae bacterium 15-036681]